MWTPTALNVLDPSGLAVEEGTFARTITNAKGISVQKVGQYNRVWTRQGTGAWQIETEFWRPEDAPLAYGQLTIKTDPPGAKITVDGKVWQGVTNRADWTSVGQHTIKLTLPNCAAEEGSVAVTADEPVTFERKLRCGPPKVRGR